MMTRAPHVDWNIARGVRGPRSFADESLHICTLVWNPRHCRMKLSDREAAALKLQFPMAADGE